MSSNGLQKQVLAPSDHLLRTFAAVPVGSRVLVIGCDEGRHVVPLIRLGFDVNCIDPDLASIDRWRSRLDDELGEEGASQFICAHRTSLDEEAASYDWAVMYRAFRSRDASVADLVATLSDVRRVVVPGGWVYVALDAGDDSPASVDQQVLQFYDLMRRADLELAESAEVLQEDGHRIIRGIFRRVDPDIPI